MKKNSNKELVKELFDKGMEKVDIVNQLEGSVSQSTVYKWVGNFEKEQSKLESSSSDELEEVDSPEDNETTDEPETELDEGSVSTTEEENKLSGHQENSVLPGSVLDANENLENEEIEQATLREQQERIRMNKKLNTAARLINSLSRRLTRFSEKRIFSIDQNEEFHSDLEVIQDMIEDAFHYDKKTFRKNIYWLFTQRFINKLESLRRASEAPTVIESYGLLSYEEELYMQSIIDIENDGNENHESIVFTTKFHALIRNGILSNNDEDLHYTKLELILSDIDHILAYASENSLSSLFTQEMEVLVSLREIISGLNKQAKDSRFFKSEVLELSEEMYSKLKGMLEVAFTAISKDELEV